MQNILYLLYRYGYVILFVILQILCINLVISFNSHQNTIFIKSSNSMSGWLLDRYEGVVQFFNLSKVAGELASQNAALQTKVLNIEDIYSPVSSHIDSNGTQKYQLIAARVINNSVANLDNFFTLNVGKRDGVDNGMGVIQPDGVMGVLVDVGARYSKGISLLNRDSKISVAVERNHFFGTLSWPGGDPKKAILSDVAKHADLVEGDGLVTSGYSALFPEGLKVGKITSFSLKQGSNFYDIKVELSNDISTAHYVYVVKNLHAFEQMNIDTKDGEGNN